MQSTEPRTYLTSKGFAAVIAGAVTIGTAAIFMRLSEVSPTATAFWRMTLSLPLLALWVYFARSKLPRRIAENRVQSTGGTDRWAVARDLFLVGFWFAADLAMWHWSVAMTTVANATLLANMAAIFTAIAGWLFLKEKMNRNLLIALLLAVAGAFALVGQNLEFNPDYVTGDLLGLATSVAYAGYILSGSRARRRSPTAVIMTGSGLVTALLLLPLALMSEGPFLPASLTGWAPLIGLAWGAHILGQSLIMYGLAHVPPTAGSISLLVQPVVSAILAWVLFGEALGPLHALGAALIFAGILFAKKSA